MRDANAKVDESNTSRVSMQNDAKIMQKFELKTPEMHTAMVENEYGITTGLPIGKVSKFEVL